MSAFRKNWTKRSAGTRFLVLVGLFVGGFCIFELWQTWSASRDYLYRLLNNQAELALEYNLAVREYVNEHVRPFAEKHLSGEEFELAVMSCSYVSRAIFEQVQKKFPQAVIKFSSDNPRNPANKAGVDEERILRVFNQHPQLERWSGPITLDGAEYLAHFTARRMEERCLGCHGSPSDAPNALLKRYGSKSGFGWKNGQVMSLDMAAFPLDVYRADMRRGLLQRCFLLVGLLGGLFASVYFAYRFVVGRPLKRISEHFQRAARQGEETVLNPIEVDSDDEIGVLAGGFNALAGRLKELYGSLEERVKQRTSQLQAANAELEREVEVRSRAEKALLIKQFAIDRASDAIFLVGPEGRIQDVNESACAGLGYSHNELVGERLDKIEPEWTEQSWSQRWDRIKTGGQKVFHSYLRRKDGTLFPVEVGTNYLEYESGEYMCAFVRDLTARRQAEQEGRQEQERVSLQRRVLLELATLPEVGQGEVEQAAVQITERSAEVLGVHRAGIWLLNDFGTQLTCVDLYDLAKREHTSGHILEVKDYPSYFEAVSQGRVIDVSDATRDGRTLEFTNGYLLPLGIASVLNGVIRVGGKVAGVICYESVGECRSWRADEIRYVGEVADQISQALMNKSRRESEQQTQRLAALAMESSKAKSNVLASVSHQIRTPMNAILGFSELLEDVELDQEHRQYLKVIRSSGLSLLALVNDILDFSKMEAGKLRLEPLEFSLVELLNDMEAMFRPMAEAKGIGYDMTRGADVPERMKGDPARLRQCLTNLLNNAVRFTERGRVGLKVSSRQADGREWVQFDVEDTGIGIDAERQPMIFETFAQADVSAARKYGGTGLGLSITRRLAELMGGGLSLVSQRSVGSVFTLTVPAEFSASAGRDKEDGEHERIEQVQKISTV